jgi:hypothetical protein
MTNITVNGLKDFQMCERLYDYRHVEKMPEKIYSRDIYTDKFENTIKNIIYFFFFKKQSGIVPSYSALLNRWEKMWFPKDTTSYDIVTEQHETVYGNIASLTSKAAASLLMFYETYSDSAYIPIAIAEDFLVPGKNGQNISDTFDVILYKDKTFHVIKLMFNYKQSNRDQYKIDFATLYKGFETRHPERMSEAKFGMIDMMSQNLNFSEFLVSDSDINNLELWYDKLHGTEIFAPKRGLIPYCKKCPFDDPCSKWTGWKKDNQ